MKTKLTLFLLAVVLIGTGCATKLDKIVEKLTPPKDPGLVTLKVTGSGFFIDYVRDNRPNGSTNQSETVTITPQTTLKMQKNK